MRTDTGAVRAVRGMLVLGLLLGPAAPATAAPLLSDVALSGQIGWSDNITGVASNQQSETILGIGAQGRLGRTGQSTGLSGLFDLQYLNYLNGEYDDQLVGSADLQAKWELVPDVFSLVVEDVFGQTQTSAFAPSTPETSQNTNILSAGADARLEFGTRMLILASGRYAIESYQRTSESENRRWQGTAGLYHEFSGRSSIGALVQAQDVTFKESSQYDDFSRTEYLLRYRLSAPRTTLQVDGGRSELRGRGVRQLRQDLWIYRLQLSRNITPRSSLDVSVGRELSDAGDLFSVAMESFGQRGNLRQMGLGAVQMIGAGVFATGDVLRSTYVRGAWRFSGPRSSAYAGVDVQEERYFNAAAVSRDNLVVYAGLTRNFTSRVSATLDLRNSHRDAEVATIQVDDFSATLTGNFRYSRRTTFGTALEYARRSDNGGGDYDDHRAWLRVSWSPTQR